MSGRYRFDINLSSLDICDVSSPYFPGYFKPFLFFISVVCIIGLCFLGCYMCRILTRLNQYLTIYDPFLCTPVTKDTICPSSHAWVWSCPYLLLSVIYWDETELRSNRASFGNRGVTAVMLHGRLFTPIPTITAFTGHTCNPKCHNDTFESVHASRLLI